MSSILLAIVDWHWFENPWSRSVKHLKCVCVPNDFQHPKLRRLMRRSRAAELLGVYLSLAALASRCPVRGALMLNATAEGPLDQASLSSLTGLSERCLERAIDVLASNEVALLEQHDISFVRDDGKWTLPADLLYRLQTAAAAPTKPHRKCESKDDLPPIPSPQIPQFRVGNNGNGDAGSGEGS